MSRNKVLAITAAVIFLGAVIWCACGNIYTFEVDADMNIIQEWSYGGQAVWDDAHDEAYAMFTRAKDVFGL